MIDVLYALNFTYITSMSRQFHKDNILHLYIYIYISHIYFCAEDFLLVCMHVTHF